MKEKIKLCVTGITQETAVKESDSRVSLIYANSNRESTIYFEPWNSDISNFHHVSGSSIIGVM